MTVDLPADVRGEVQALVRAGEYPDVETAVADLVRKGLETKSRRDTDLPDPTEPGGPQGLPDDVNWM